MKLFAPKRIYIVLGIFVVANVLATLKVATDKSFFNSSDFIAYSVGAKMVVDGQGKNLYDLNLQTAYWDNFLGRINLSRTSQYILPYLAPPITALLYLPYLFIPLGWQIQVAMLNNFLLILAGTLVVGKIAQNKRLALFTVFSSWFVWVCVWQIQPTALLFLITALLYASLTKKSYALAGVLCAFYIIKPQYLIIAPLIFLLTGKSATFIKTFLASLFVLLTINVLISGPHALFVDYPKLLTATDNPNYGNRWYEMYSIQQITYRFSRFLTDSKIPPLIIGALFYLWGLFKVNKLVDTKKTVADLFPIVVIITLLSAYHVLSQDMCLSAIPLFLAASSLMKIGSLVMGKFVLVLMVMGSGMESYHLANYYTMILIVLLYYLTNVRLREIKT